MIIKKGKCLDDNQITQFVDGCLSDDGSVIAHINICTDCFEQVAFVMNFISEYSELCEEINMSYNKMVTENIVGHYIRKIKKYLYSSWFKLFNS